MVSIPAMLIGAGAMKPVIAQGTLTTLATFNLTNGAGPEGSLVFDTAGNLYGTTSSGGANGDGTVFEVAALTHAFSTPVTFNTTNGAFPVAGLIADGAGNLYGTTESGGTDGIGTVFEVAAGSHALSTLATFNAGSGDAPNGGIPMAGLIADAGGNLYGTTTGGGQGLDGTVFKVAAGTHALSALASFNGTNGMFCTADLVADTAGNLYGTTQNGGANGAGNVFEVAAGTRALSNLVTFNNTNGFHPSAGLIIDSSGNLYGTTAAGGLGPLGLNAGTVFEVGAGTHLLSTLVNFPDIVSGGAVPLGDLIADAAGNLYGTTDGGGNAGGLGTVFEVTAGTHAVSYLATFNVTNIANGISPKAGLVADAAGNLYGTTYGGGGFMNSYGTVFEVSPGTSSWAAPVAGNWNTTSNWSLATAPTSSSNANFNTGSASSYTVTLSTDTSASNINVQGDKVTIQMAGNNLNVGYSMTISGTSLHNSSLTLASGGVTTVGSLTISNYGQLGINEKELMVNYGNTASPNASIRQYLQNGYNAGFWDAGGTLPNPAVGAITSGTAAASSNAFSLGYADGSDGVVAGLSGGQEEIKFTYAGDANLDGQVNLADLIVLAGHFGSAGAQWDQGDFTYDGSVNLTDLIAIAGHFGDGVGSPVNFQQDLAMVESSDPAFAIEVSRLVPEPSSIALLTLGGLALLKRRPRPLRIKSNINRPLGALAEPPRRLACGER